MTRRFAAATLLATGIIVTAWLVRQFGHTPRTSVASPSGNGAMIFEPMSGRIHVQTDPRATVIDVIAVIDGTAHNVQLSEGDLVRRDSQRELFALPSLNEALSLELEAEVLSETRGMRLHLRAQSISEPHTIALRLKLILGSQIAFAPSIGVLLAPADVRTPAFAVLGEAALAVTSPTGPLNALLHSEGNTIVTLTSPDVAVVSDSSTETILSILATPNTQAIWKSLFSEMGATALPIRGRVLGAHGASTVTGSTGHGSPWVRFTSQGSTPFEVFAPKDATEWSAAIDNVQGSQVVTAEPGAASIFTLDVSPGGEVHVRVLDEVTKKPITARLFFRGTAGTPDPNFGPDYRSSGAGPIVESATGDVTTPLPAGKYFVGATKGLMYTVDRREIEVSPGRPTQVVLSLKKVVAVDGAIGCDLHVHARPSFDTPTLNEDRVLSLVASGVDFAVATEHNAVGDYTSGVDALETSERLSWAPGVEITTYGPAYGHFGVFPVPLNSKPPPHRGPLKRIFELARAGDDKRMVVIHHPRLPKGIGYFNILGYKANQPAPKTMRMDFDAIEVFNGYDGEFPERTDAVLRDYFSLLKVGHKFVATGSSDSHRVQFHWAGFPRTLVQVGDTNAWKTNPQLVFDALKKGRATVTNGPIIDFSLNGIGPGDTLARSEAPAHARLHVRAAPWIDVTRADVFVNGDLLRSFPAISHPTVWGSAVEGPNALDETFDIDLHAARFVVVVARGQRRMDDVLPYMPMIPLGFTNPIWVE